MYTDYKNYKSLKKLPDNIEDALNVAFTLSTGVNLLKAVIKSEVIVKLFNIGNLI